MGSASYSRSNNEVKAKATNFDQVAIVQANGSGNWCAVDRRNAVAGAQVIAVVALIDLCRHSWLEPSAQTHRGHGRFADDRELVDEKKLFLMHPAGKNHQSWREFQNILNQRGVVLISPVAALSHLQIGRAYATQGDTTKAAYHDFFTLWKDADPEIPIFIAAKAEYAKLQ